MPIYDYVCSSCRHRVEVIHGINDPGPRFCPSCGTEATMRKALVTPAIHFKGSGWAKKDRSSASRARSTATSGGSGSGDSTVGDAGTSAASDAGSSGAGSPDAKSTSTGASTAASSAED